MARPLLLLRLEGPLQAWGLRARWDVRDTGDEPSKSAVVGLLGCALGYGVQDPRLEELEQQLRMGVREERAGSRFVDFQTISGEIPTAEGGVKGSLLDPSTIVSPRAYLQDAAFLVVLDGPAPVLNSCAAALQTPRWPLYLGRKSCVPTRPIFAGVTARYDSITEALEEEDWLEEGSGQAPEGLRCVIDLTEAAGESAQSVALRPDRIRRNPARMYDNRAVSVFWAQGRRPIQEPQGGET